MRTEKSQTLESDLVDNANPRFNWARQAPPSAARELAVYHKCDCEGRGSVRDGDVIRLCECRRHGPTSIIKRELHRRRRAQATRRPERIPTMAEIWDWITSHGR